MTTIAQQVAAQFDNDGQTWKDVEGRRLSEVCDKLAVSATQRSDGHGGYTYRYVFEDNSVLLEGPDCWDLESETERWLMQCAE
jgi:hypothetical protein